MSMNPLRKIDKFYYLMALVMVILAIPVVLTVQTIFSSYITSTELLSGSENSARIDKIRMQEAIDIVYEREPADLNVRETSIVISEPEDDVEETTP